MKKYIIFMLAMFMAFTSCYVIDESKNAGTTPHDVYKEIYLTRINSNGETVAVDLMLLYDIEINGHKYLLIRNGEDGTAIVHNPDCPCHNKNTNTSIETKPDSTGSYFDIW
jgi:hypothetical protein